MFYDPILDKWCTPVTLRQQWADVIDTLSNRIAKAIKDADAAKAFKWINVLDLIDIETAAYYKEYGFEVYGGTGNEEVETDESVLGCGQPVSELAFQPGPVSLI